MLEQLEHFLGQTWVTVAAFIIGPAILFLMHRHRFRRKGDAKKPAEAAVRPETRPESRQRASDPAPTTRPAEPAVAREPIWPGYRDLRWGQQPVDGMTVLHEDGDMRFLVRPSDEPRIGGIHVTSIVYSFRQDRLEAVIIELPISGFEPLNRHLASTWGSPRSAADRSRHVWADSGSGPGASQAVLEKRPENRTARLVLSSRAAHAERAKTRASD